MWNFQRCRTILRLPYWIRRVSMKYSEGAWHWMSPKRSTCIFLVLEVSTLVYEWIEWSVGDNTDSDKNTIGSCSGLILLKIVDNSVLFRNHMYILIGFVRLVKPELCFEPWRHRERLISSQTYCELPSSIQEGMPIKVSGCHLHTLICKIYYILLFTILLHCSLYQSIN